MAYSGFRVPEGTFSRLTANHGIKFDHVYGHHVTHQFGKLTDTELNAVVEVIGYVSDESLETFVVTVNGSTKRPDGSVYHMTWSLDRKAGRKPVDSNKLIKEKGWTALDQPYVKFSADLEVFN